LTNPKQAYKVLKTVDLHYAASKMVLSCILQMDWSVASTSLTKQFVQ